MTIGVTKRRMLKERHNIAPPWEIPALRGLTLEMEVTSIVLLDANFIMHRHCTNA